MIRGANLATPGGAFLDADFVYVSEKKAEELKGHLAFPGDLVFTQRGTLGQVARIPEDARFSRYVLSQSQMKITVDEETADPDFVFFHFCSPWAQEYIRQHAITTGVPHINLAILREFPIPLPPRSTQGRIAAALRPLYDKIELNRKMNRTLEEIAQTLFRAWFVDFEGETDLVESEPGPIPRGWEVGGLEDIAEFLNGVACQRYHSSDEGEVLRVIKIRELRSGFSESSDLVSREELPSQYEVEDGDILFSWSGSLEVKIWSEGRGALNQHIFKVTPIAVPRWFVYFWLLEFLPEFRHIAASKATTMGHIRRGHLQEARLPVPPKSALERADAVIGPLLDRFLLNELQSRTLSDLRDTLLPKLISGEIRIPEAEQALEEAV